MINTTQRKLIENNILAFGTANKIGKPNVIAIGFCKVIDNDKILITDNFFNKTKTNLLENPQVSIAVWSGDGEEGFQFIGTARYLTEGNYKEMVDKDPNNKGYAHKAAVLVTVNEIWDLAEPKLVYKR